MRCVETDAIVAAYQQTGSVWKAGKALGLAGQTVHERLRAIGYPLNGRHWTAEERAEVVALAGNGLSCAQIAHRLGRTFAAVASVLSRAGVKVVRARPVKIPRGAGYDKVSILRHLRALEAGSQPVTRYARANGLNVESFVRALQRHAPDRWEAYQARTSPLPTAVCPYCEREFIPSNGKQQFCTRACGDHARADRSYFEGRRRNTIGLADGICQLCNRKVTKGLSSHHVFGRENDLENLIALCPGCHKLITLLGSRTFLDDPATWEALIQLAYMRHYPDRFLSGDGAGGIYVCVDIDVLTGADVEAMA